MTGANGTIPMEMDTETMLTDQELTCSPTIPVNGTIPTETVLAITETSSQPMEHNGPMMTATAMVTILTARTATST